jgi:hypothetical protein
MSWFISRQEAGMVTSEYAVGIIGGCGLACVLLLLSPEFDDLLRAILERGLGPVIPRLLW